MSQHVHTQSVPKFALVGAALLMTLTLAVAGFSKAGRDERREQPGPALAAVELRFEDRPNGSIAVLDAFTGKETSLVPAGTNGFIRGVLRGMFRERKLEAMGRDGHFRLSREANGRLMLEDLGTHRRVDLDAFGPTNSAAFADLLTAAGRVSSR
jgi:putative photosynthetic complex assembly protein